MRIAVFGGSFDPIHHGHLVAALVAGEAIEADEIRLVPTGQQPLKAGQHYASAVERAEMTELAAELDSAFVVDRAEIERPGPSYTIDTLRDLRGRYPAARFSLLLGSDAAQFLPKWREPEAVREMAEIVVFNRAGDAQPALGGCRFVTVPRLDISSTVVRERVRAGKSIRYWVPDAVARYVDSHALYRE